MNKVHVGDSGSFGGVVESGSTQGQSSLTSIPGREGVGGWGMGQGGASAE